MKISEPKWSPYSKELNQEALDHPQVGDYWHERFCPYFLIVDILGDKYTVLCGFPDDEVAQMARIIGEDNWQFDYSKHSVVTKEWIKDKVTYDTIPGFVADVVRSDKMLSVVKEWREANPGYVPEHVPYFKQHEEWWLGV
jgi:hypothetical protein